MHLDIPRSLDPRKTQDARRAAIAAALPGQLDRRTKDAAVHRALNLREAKRMASTFVAEDKWRRDWRLWP